MSYGACYHPWPIEREAAGNFRRVPPDGAACGVLARRALSRGAWVAPANELLSGVVALTPPIDRRRWLDLQEARVNLFRHEPAGFLALDADTLIDDEDLRPINVRRLLFCSGGSRSAKVPPMSSSRMTTRFAGWFSIVSKGC